MKRLFIAAMLAALSVPVMADVNITLNEGYGSYSSCDATNYQNGVYTISGGKTVIADGNHFYKYGNSKHIALIAVHETYIQLRDGDEILTFDLQKGNGNCLNSPMSGFYNSEYKIHMYFNGEQLTIVTGTKKTTYYFEKEVF